MSDFFNMILELGQPFNMVAVLFLIYGIYEIITSVFKHTRGYLCHREEIAFKRELVDQGMSSEEIVQIIGARSAESSSGGDTLVQGGSTFVLEAEVAQNSPAHCKEK